MKVLKVLTLWKGMVAVRSKYYEQGKREGLLIKHAGQQMALSPYQVQHDIEKGSGPYPDQFSQAKHKLFYYKWKPGQQLMEQETLL